MIKFILTIILVMSCVEGGKEYEHLNENLYYFSTPGWENRFFCNQFEYKDNSVLLTDCIVNGGIVIKHAKLMEYKYLGIITKEGLL